MAQRRWWSKRRFPSPDGSEVLDISSLPATRNKRSRFQRSQDHASSQQRPRGARLSQSSVPSTSSVLGSRTTGQQGSTARQHNDETHQNDVPKRGHRLTHCRPNLEHYGETDVARANDSVVGDALDDAEEDDSLNETILALDVQGRVRGTTRMGACYYVAHEEKLYVLIDVQSGGLEAVDTVRIHAQPTVVLLSSRVDEEVDKILDPRKGYEAASTERESNLCLPYSLDVRPASEFDYNNGKQRLSELQLPSDSNSSINLIVPGEDEAYEGNLSCVESGFTRRQGKLLALSTYIDLESMLSVGCCAVLLSYLERRRDIIFLPNDPDAAASMRISRIETFSLSGYMLVNNDTLSALQIVQSQSHPSAHNQGPHHSGSKEDISAYGLFYHLAQTPQGRMLLHQYFVRPSLDLSIIRERHAVISVFLQPQNESKMEEIVKCLKQIQNMRMAMLHLRKGICNGLSRVGGLKNGVWSRLRAFTFFTLAIRTTCSQISNPEQLPVFTRVSEEFHTQQLAAIGRLVTQIVDFPRSQQLCRTVVKPGVDDELDELKRSYDGLEDLLGESSRNIAATIPQQLGIEVQVVFLPQIGFLICMSMDPETRRATWEGGPGEAAWERIFSTEMHVYYKESRMRELDARVGDVYAAVCDKEIEIVHELAQRVLLYEDMLCRVSDICGELDAILALAQGAQHYKLTRPHMTAANVIDIHEGRHLLQERTVPICIPNDALLAGGERSDEDEPQMAPGQNGLGSMPSLPCQRRPGPSMLVLTGPNYSGKSVYLKQVALIVYLAHVGSFVPASRATIGCCDAILTRVATRESVARAASAFAIDLQQVSTALRMATRHSLLLLDEFGKGTAPVDGAALLAGVCQHLLQRPSATRPMALVATHFHELLTPTDACAAPTALLSPHPHLAFAHFAVHLDETSRAAGPATPVTYLYRLTPGPRLTSLGLACAAMSGLDPAVVARAEQLLTLEAQGGDLVGACCAAAEEEEDAADSQQVRKAERIARAFLYWELDAMGTEHAEARLDSSASGTGEDLKHKLDALLAEDE